MSGNTQDPIIRKIAVNQKDDKYLSEAESERLVNAYIKFKSKYIPEIDYKKPETFAYFGSAKRYYEDTIQGIYNSYPYDGSKAEKMEWAISASFLDLYFLEHEYPKATGHITFDRTGDTIVDAIYPETDNDQYIEFTGGPHVGTVFDSDNNRESNLKINGVPGNTIEFWLKKDSSSWYSTAGRREIIFDIYTDDFTPSDDEYGRLVVGLENPSPVTDSPFYFTYVSGTTQIDINVGSSNVNKASVGDGEWHHYAISVLSGDTSTTIKFYVDGNLDSTQTVSDIIGSVDRAIIGTIGALADSDIDGNGARGDGKLEASIDEFRFWKEARTEKEIGRFWYSPVHGGTDKDHTNANLGLYYKFNEGITGVEEHDKVVLDYSGRVGNGQIVNWDSGMRQSTSGIDQSNNLPESNFTEIGDPIVNSDNTLVKNVLTQYKNIGQAHDNSNMASLVNSVPSFLHDSDPEQLFAELLQIMASSFDNIFLKIKNLPKMKDYAYQEFFKESGQYRNSLGNNFLLGCEDTYLFEFTGNYTKPWVNHILQHFGLVTTEIFPDASLFEMFYERSEQLRFEHSLAEVRNTILSNIHKNLVHIFKTKGTEKSFRNLIRCFGVDQELIRLNAYGRREEFPVELKPVYSTLKQKSISFEGENYQGTIHQTASTSGELGYIPAESGKKPLSVSSNFYFTKKTGFNSSEVQQVSLFGMHSVEGSSNPSAPLTWATQDTGSFQVYFNKRLSDSSDGYFELSSSQGVFTAITSSVIPAVYDNTHWNITVRIGNRTDVGFGVITPSAQNQYIVELIGHEYELDVLKNSFHVTSSISEADYLKLSTQDKAVYLGAHRTNFTGAVVDSSDVRSFGLTVWRDIIEDEEIKEYAKNPAHFGRKDPLAISKHDDGENLTRAEALIMRWQFENLTTANASDEMNIVDFAGEAGESAIARYKYPGLAIEMVNNEAAIQQEFLPVIEYNPIDNLHTSDRVKIKDQEINKFEADSRPVTYFYSFEKSMYQVISREMINMFASLVGYNNIIGEPVHKYRLEYKGLEKLRERFFRRVQNDIDLDKFVEYYRWIDYSLTNFLNQLIPATSDFDQSIKNVVESHTLERNKYRHKFPTMRLKSEIPTGVVYGGGAWGQISWAMPPGFLTQTSSERINENSIHLDGVDDRILVGDYDIFTFSNGATDIPFSISAWIYVEDISTDIGTIVGKFTASGTGNEWMFKQEVGKLHFYMYDFSVSGTGARKQIVANSITLSNNTWHHVVITSDGGSHTGYTLYTDAVVTAGTGTTVGGYVMTQNTNAPLTIGAADLGSGNRIFEDRIADVVIFNKELSAAEVTEIYNGYAVKNMDDFSDVSSIISWWKMGDDQDTSGAGGIIDYVGGYNGTLENGASIQAEPTLDSDTVSVQITPRLENDVAPTEERSGLFEVIRGDIPGFAYSTSWATNLSVSEGSNETAIGTGINTQTSSPLSILTRINSGEQIVITQTQLEEEN